MAFFKVIPRTAKERTRVVEHGEIWRDTTVPHFKLPNKVLLESVKTEYVRWWFCDQVESTETEYEGLG